MLSSDIANSQSSRIRTFRVVLTFIAVIHADEAAADAVVSSLVLSLLGESDILTLQPPLSPGFFLFSLAKL